jgi:2-keto-4-pentenoate hydratase/2-oxohepta-3-ene-1,7-dioic acid hydratase in catechol pathway
MKFATYFLSGRESYGLVDADGIVDLGTEVGNRYPTLRSAVAGGELVAIARKYAAASKRVPLPGVRLLPPIPEPGKLICFGGAFPSHLAEMKKGPPKYPGFHIRSSSSLVGDGTPLQLPTASNDFDYECELAVIIGKGGRNIRKETAEDHIFGYSCFNDGSIRDFQLEHSICAGKNFNASGSFGPWIVTRDELPDLSELRISTVVNGVTLQEARMGEMLLTPADFIAYSSIVMQLHPGDVISTGCPGGVGYFRDPKLYLRAGDRVEISIDGIGTLHHEVINQLGELRI